MPLRTLEQVQWATTRERLLISATRRGEESLAMGDKFAAIRDVCLALTQGNVPFALIGGVAVGIHSGVARATLDVDFAVESTQDRSAIIAAMLSAGFTPRGEHAHSLNFVHSSGEPVQLAFDARFDPMLARVSSFEIDGAAVPIVTKPDLIQLKQMAASDPGRRRSKALRDQADIALLEGDVPDPDEGW